MPSRNKRCISSANKTPHHSAKQHAKDQGGEIVHELDIIKGFSYVALAIPHSPSPALKRMTLMDSHETLT